MMKLANKEKLESGFLQGQFLVAMPNMMDSRFKRAVVYVCSHTSQGAMGIVINQPAPQLYFADLLTQLGISPKDEVSPTTRKLQTLNVFKGGPVETSRGFVLHSSDCCISTTTQSIDDDIYLTATLDIIKLIAVGDGPRDVFFALGYAGWSAGQLEQEMHDNSWLNCKADADILFHTDVATRYDNVLKIIGIEPKDLAFISQSVGHA